MKFTANLLVTSPRDRLTEGRDVVDILRRRTWDVAPRILPSLRLLHKRAPQGPFLSYVRRSPRTRLASGCRNIWEVVVRDTPDGIKIEMPH